MLYSDKILCFKEFEIPDTDEELSNFWDDATLRKWLNSYESMDNSYDEAGFLSQANFTKEERSVIKKSDIDVYMPRHKVSEKIRKDIWGVFENECNGYSDAPYAGGSHGMISYMSSIRRIESGGASKLTKDRMFLLNERQIYNIYESFGSGAAELAAPIAAEYARENYNHAFWLRTPYNGAREWIDHGFQNNPLTDPQFGCIVSGENSDEPYKEVMTSINNKTYEQRGDRYTWASVDEQHGVRPAFYLDTEKAVITSGSGTKEDPYVLNGNPVIDIYLNGTELDFDVQPMIKDGIVLVPLDDLLGGFNSETNWDDATRTLTASVGEDIIGFALGSNVISKNGESIDIGYPIQAEDNRMMAPLSAIEQISGISVAWDAASYAVMLTAN